MNNPRLRPGDHICALYSKPAELVRIVGEYLADGLSRHQQCWYVTPGDERDAICADLERRKVDVEAHIASGALNFFSSNGTYIVHGLFEPERAIKTFNEAIANAYDAGFTAFRAAAEMSWALNAPDRITRLIEYEALLRALFSTSRAIGLCLYDRTCTPLNVVDGALSTHPLVQSAGQYQSNQFYNPRVTGLPNTDDATVLEKLNKLSPST